MEEIAPESLTGMNVRQEERQSKRKTGIADTWAEVWTVQR